MKKAANLKKRLDKLRDEPEPLVEMTLKLDADFHRTLKQLTSREHLPLEAFIMHLLTSSLMAINDQDVE